MKNSTHEESKLVIKTIAKLSDQYNKIIFDYRDTIDRLTEQLRLANEDAERLASVVKAYSGITVTERAYPNDETTYQFAYDALRLHEERIAQESE